MGSLPLRSDDSGQTFKEVANSPQPTCGAILVMTPSGQRMYVVDGAGFWRPDDRGRTWSSAASPDGTFNTAVVDPTNPDMVCLGSTHLGVQKSTDCGKT